MSYQIKLRTNIKRDDRFTSASSTDRYVQGTYTKNGWNWQRPAIEEKVKPSGKGTVFIFADGMDGQTHKEKAAELAINAVKAHFENMEELPDSDAGKNEELQLAFLEAHHAVVEDIKNHPERDGMGTNLFVHWFNENKSYLGWNSLNNFYLFRDDKLKKIDGEPFHIWSFIDQAAVTSSDEVHHSLGNKNLHHVSIRPMNL